MGQPKQLLPWGDTTLIEHQITTIIETGNPVIVILGSNSELILPIIKNYPVSVFINNSWESGKGSSISFGILQIINKYPKADGVLICLLDQPLVTASYLKRMLDRWLPGLSQIMVSKSVSGWSGVPVIIDKCYFQDLLKLENDQGAKSIIQRNEKQVIFAEGGELIEDMDTPQSYQKMLHKYLSP